MLQAGVDDLSRLGHSLIVQPVLAAGDVLICVSALMHGVRCWRGEGPPPTILACEYVGNVSPPSGDKAFAVRHLSMAYHSGFQFCADHSLFERCRRQSSRGWLS